MWQDIKNFYHLFSAILANLKYGFPSKKLIIVGVTGTDGKTTTVNLIYHILKSAGKNVSMISSIGALINSNSYDTEFHRTTPSSFMLQSFLRMAVNKGSQYFVLEVTSHAIDQYRIWGIDFEAAVLTNVSYEHLDYHNSYKNYLKTKVKLLNKAKIAIVNMDDESFKNSEFKIQNSKFRTYGMDSKADVNPQKFPFKTKLIGEFNKYNILAAVGACEALGVDKKSMLKNIESFKPPLGRSNLIYGKDFKVMIDFAHTPNAFFQLLSSLRKDVKGKIIHVFGSAGERDKQKRREMGRFSDKYSDVIILTSEDPRSESIESIMDDIQKGIKNGQKVVRIPDRKKAIAKGISLAEKGDFVLLTGKGHEQSMNYGSGEVAWNEYKAVEEAIKSKNYKPQIPNKF